MYMYELTHLREYCLFKHSFVCHVPKVFKWLFARNYGIKEVETAILEHDEDFHFTYDTVQRKLVDIQTIP